MKPVTVPSAGYSFDTLTFCGSLGILAMTLMAERVNRARDYLGTVPNIEQTTREALGAATAASTPAVEGSFISSALSAVKIGASVAWNFVPNSTKLLMAAALVYWAWRKWKGDASGGVHVQNNNTSKVEIHLHGIAPAPGPTVLENIRKERDGTTTTVIDMTFSDKNEPRKRILIVPSGLFRRLLSAI